MAADAEAGEAEMTLGHPDRDRRRHERSGGLAAACDDLAADRIGADQTGQSCCSIKPVGRMMPRLDRR